MTKTCITEFAAGDVICHSPPGTPGKKIYWKIKSAKSDQLPNFGYTIFWNVIQCTKTGKVFKRENSFTLHPHQKYHNKDFLNSVFSYMTTVSEDVAAIKQSSIQMGKDKRRMNYLRGVISAMSKELKQLEEKYDT